MIAEALRLDSIGSQVKSFPEFVKLVKSAVTPEAVRKIHLTVAEIWPDKRDLERCLAEEKSRHSGLYIGTYLFDVTANLLNRHALYDSTIILIDPFHDFRNIATAYNPIEKPEEHITTTFHYSLLWLQLLPWIEAGIVRIIRDPGDIDHQLRKITWEISRTRSESTEVLKAALKNQNRPEELEDFFRDQYSLSHPDEFWIKQMKDIDVSEDELRGYLKKKREESLYFVDHGNKSQLLYWSSGVNYEMGKYICEKTDSHIITDFDYRWKEIEYDRKANGEHVNAWTPFSKAFQNAELHYLNGISLDDLLKLRLDGHLEDMRGFLRRVWNASAAGDEFDTNNEESLAAELRDHINTAKHEWSKIDTKLATWFGGESVLGTAIGVTAGTANWLPAVSIAAAGMINLAVAASERKSFIPRYPAAFFIGNIRKKV